MVHVHLLLLKSQIGTYYITNSQNYKTILVNEFNKKKKNLGFGHIHSPTILTKLTQIDI